MRVRLNTSSEGKLKEFRELFARHGMEVEAARVDLPEIQADPPTVVVHKASQVPEGVLVEDTSLHVEGAEVGIEVRWLLDHLQELEGKKAQWICLLAQRVGNKVRVYSGVVEGRIVRSKGTGGFGFDPYFMPDGRDETLAESKPDDFNARALAVALFIAGVPSLEREPIFNWRGQWQSSS